MIHPYIGKRFRDLRHPRTGPDAGKHDVFGVCVAVGQCGTVGEGYCAFLGAVLRLDDGTHIETEMTSLVGPLDESGKVTS